jgi:D-glucuronyl C5-epimerase C-terminus
MTEAMLALLIRGVRNLRMHTYPVEDDLRPDGGGLYPLDLNLVGRQFRPGPDGVVMVPGPDGREFYNPVSASLFALARHTRAYRDRASQHENVAAFLSQADHLRARQDTADGWRYPVAVARYGLVPGWYSAMAQGLAISVMLRSFDLTGQPSYLDSAHAANTLMLRPITSGGCSDYDEGGRPFLEECPCVPCCHILNGALCALIGLHELEMRTGEIIHTKVTQRLVGQLGKYDLGYWSRYDLRFAAPATLAYHSLHVSLLEVAARLFGNHVFSDTAARWKAYARHPGYRLRAAAGKARFVLGEKPWLTKTP